MQDDRESEVVVLQSDHYREVMETLSRIKATSARSANELAYQMQETTNKVRSQMLAQIRIMERDQAILRQQMTDIEERAETKVGNLETSVFHSYHLSVR